MRTPDTVYSSYYVPALDQSIPCEVDYHDHGDDDFEIVAVRHNADGPDISDTLDETQKADLLHHISLALREEGQPDYDDECRSFRDPAPSHSNYWRG